MENVDRNEDWARKYQMQPQIMWFIQVMFRGCECDFLGYDVM
jgi:hypothetical protein